MPVVSKDNIDQKSEIYKRTFSVLRPEVKKLVSLMHFQERVSRHRSQP